MPRVFLTGGGGYIGGQLARALLARGDELVALARSEAAARSLDELGASVIRGDVLDDRGRLAEAMAGCELAFHVAGLNSHCPRDPEEVLRVNVDGTENVIRGAALAGVRRVVLTSSAAAVGEVQGTVGTEESPHRGHYLTTYDRSKHEAEIVAFRASRETGVPVVALNPSSVQGPPRRGGTGAVIIGFLNGRLPVFLDVPVSIVDVQDVVQAHLLAAERGRPGARYILNGSTVPAVEALRLAAEIAGIRRRVRLVGADLARTIARASDTAFGLFGRPSPICSGRVATLLHGHRYDGSLATRELGLTYRSLRETFTRTIQWAVAEGLVRQPLPGVHAELNWP